MTRRKGYFGYILVVLIFMLLLYDFYLAAGLTDLMLGRLNGVMQESMEQNEIPETIMESRCATSSRGVFIASAVEAGRFRCGLHHLSHDSVDGYGVTEVHLRFQYDTNQRGWIIRGYSLPGSAGPTATAMDYGIEVISPETQGWSLATGGDEYRILVKNTTTGRTYAGTLTISYR